MKINPEDIIYKILEIIDYKQDKKQAAGQFIKLCRYTAITDLVNSLPSFKQQEIKNKLSGLKEPLEAKSVFSEYYSDEQYLKAIETAAKNVLEDYIKEIIPTLSASQTKTLEDYVKTIV